MIKKQIISWRVKETIIESREEIILPPNGAVVEFQDKLILYKELVYFTACSANNEYFKIWKGVQCKGNINSNQRIVIGENQIPVCELCKNQISCSFKAMDVKKDFRLKEEYEEIERVRFNEWIFNNRKKYKVKTLKNRT